MDTNNDMHSITVWHSIARVSVLYSWDSDISVTYLTPLFVRPVNTDNSVGGGHKNGRPCPLVIKDRQSLAYVRLKIQTSFIL